MVDRAVVGGGMSRPLSTVTPQAAALYASTGTGAGADWFGPGVALPPMAPPQVAGRTFDFPANYNRYTSERPFEPISWQMLRALADSYGLLRVIIETRKDQMAALEINFTAKDKTKKPTDPAVAASIAKAKKWLAEPYPGICWDDWLRRLLEDLFVLDAPTLYAQKTRGGGLYGLKPIDGATINRQVDPWGDTPQPPQVAYVQRLKGLGAVHYMADELIYRPRNPRNHKLFGFGPVEQIITIVNIGLRRETWQLNYFTEGNLPDALIGTPMEWTPDQLRNFQDWFDSRLQGSARRRGATFVPGDVAKGYVATKDTPLFGEAEDWLSRVICFCFSISNAPFSKQMNRATAHTAKATAEEEGIEPLKVWTKTLLDSILSKYLGLDNIESGFAEETDIDPLIQMEIEVGYANAGTKTRNEIRVDLGLDKDPSPEADQLMVTTTGGLVPLDLKAQIAQTKAKNAAMPTPVMGPDGTISPNGGSGPPQGGPSLGAAGGKGGARAGAAPPKPSGGRKTGQNARPAAKPRSGGQETRAKKFFYPGDLPPPEHWRVQDALAE